MAKISYSDNALADLDRLTDFLLESDVQAAFETIDLIADAVSILKRHPLIGRPVVDDLRELVISRGRTGYVAFYSYEESVDRVLVLAIRHQREAGYWGQE